MLLCCQVFSMFLETLVDFILLHREDLQDWLFVLLTQLLKKMGADLLGSVQAKVQKALDVTRLELYWKNKHRCFLLQVLFIMHVHTPFSLILQGLFPLRSAVQHLDALHC